MGFTPKEIRGMSLWEFRATIDGFVKANGGGEDKSSTITEDEYDDILARLYDPSPVEIAGD